MAPATALAQSLTTPSPQNNGCASGPMFDIAATNAVTITQIETDAINPIASVQVYYRTASSIGSETNPGAWTLVGSGSHPGGGVAAINLPINVPIPAGQTYGFYLASQGGDIQYRNGSVVGADIVADANIAIRQNAGLCSQFGFVNVPREFVGVIHYTNGMIAPVPTLTEWAMILLAATLAGGGAIVVQRRRRAEGA